MGRGLDGYFDIRALALCGFEGPGRGWSRPVSGGYGEGETPLPIPNRAVKPLSADGTWPARAWESRSPPVYLHSANDRTDRMTDARSAGPDPGARGNGVRRTRAQSPCPEPARSELAGHGAAPEAAEQRSVADPAGHVFVPDSAGRLSVPEPADHDPGAEPGADRRPHPVAAFFRANPQVLALLVICLVLGIGTFVAVLFGLVAAGSDQTTGEPSGLILGAHAILAGAGSAIG
jgi:hypothetical protein